MVEYDLDATFAALADPTRRGMLSALALGEKSVGELAEPYAMSFAGAAKHVAILERAGLIQRRKEGRQRLCKISAAQLKQASEWLGQWESFWNGQLDALEAALAVDSGGEMR
jgi:Predicted transcriptional regulators